ncbi:unnamed protein product, partial [Prunus brigantina]
PPNPEQQSLPFVTVHPTSFWAAISSSSHPKRRHEYQKNQHVVLYQPHISAAANRRLDRRKNQEIGQFLPPSLVRAIPSTICFNPGMVFQPLKLFL